MLHWIPGTAPLMYSLGWALFHSLWQGALLWICLRSILFMFPTLPSKAKYSLAYLSLAALFTWFAFTFYHQWNVLQGVNVTITETGSNELAGKTIRAKAFPGADIQFTQANSFAGYLEQAFPWFTLLYAGGILFLTLKFILGFICINRWKTSGTSKAPSELQFVFDGLLLQLKPGKKIRLLLSSRVNMPMMIGWLKPVILLPVASFNQLTMEQLEAILLHELAHIRRNDFIFNILQVVLETILFFNPFAKIISDIIRREREHCCDDIVLSQTSRPIPYARALTSFETYRIQNQTLAIASNGQKNHLLNRIKRIMEMKKQHPNYGQFAIAFLLAATVAISVAWFTPAMAQSKKEEKPKTGKKEEVTKKEYKKEKIIIIDENGKRQEYNGTADLPDDIREKIAKEKAMELADDALKMADETLRNVDITVIHDEVSKAMDKVDWDKIKEEVNKAIAEVDGEKISAEVSFALKEINLDEYKKWTEENLEKIDDPILKEKIKVEIHNAKKEMDHAKKETAIAYKEIENQKHESTSGKKNNKHVVIVRADAGNAEAHAGSGNTDKMLQLLEEEGLINKEQGFKIRKTGDALYINDVQQPDEVLYRYSKYLNGDKIIIKGDAKNLNISITK